MRPDPLQDFSLYVHFPFCTKKCPYCHFFVLQDKSKQHQDLFNAYISELDTYKESFFNKKLCSIYLGGGTPSLADIRLWHHLIDHIKKLFPEICPDIEVTLEFNPESLNAKKVEKALKAGINRVSLGVQTFDDRLLSLLGRAHTRKDILKGYHEAREAGCQNISLDLMYELPTQNQDIWEHTLEELCRLDPEHVSLYNLTFEKGTPFYRQKDVLSKELPDEQVSLKMYEIMQLKLKQQGYTQYEISAFSKPSYQSAHNTGYWLGREFLGIGPSAFSYMQQRRFQNHANLSQYLSKIKQGVCPVNFDEKLEPEAQKRELLLLALRLNEGVCLESFIKKWGDLEPLVIEKLCLLVKWGMLSQKAQHFKLTQKGRLLFDELASHIV